MSKHSATWLAWSFWALILALVLPTLRLEFMNNPTTFWSGVFEALVELAFATVGLLVAARQPQHRIGWLFCVGALLWTGGSSALEYAVYTVITAPGTLPGGAWMTWLGGLARLLGWVLITTFLLLFFPNGRLPSLRWWPAVWLLMGNLVFFTILALFGTHSLDYRLATVQNPLRIELPAASFELLSTFSYVLSGVTIAICTFAMFTRFRHAPPTERQQIKWFAYAAVLDVVVVGFIVAATFLLPFPTRIRFGIEFGRALFVLGVAALPLAAGMAILKHRLYDIDLLIRRTLVYGVLTASIIGVYILVVGYLGILFRAEGNPFISLSATGLVAILFQPLRAFLQRSVNRLLYGLRDEPYVVLASLGQRLENTLASEAILATIVATVRDALKLTYVAIEVKTGATWALAAAVGAAPLQAPIRLPLVYQQEPVGALLIAPRGRDDALTPADRRLLDDLAHALGAAVHTVRLTSDLQALTRELQRSREHLVTAREEERRRLRRDLHDGLGPMLSAIMLKVGLVHSLHQRDPATTDRLLTELEGEIELVISDIRRLVYNLRPPALDELGLVGALREYAARLGGEGQIGCRVLKVQIEAPEPLPPLPAAVEVAAYRIVQESVTNVLRHTHAQVCCVRFAVEDALQVEIWDDGQGVEESHRVGVGLTSMRERAEELGGAFRIGKAQPCGTQIMARLPLVAGALAPAGSVVQEDEWNH